VARLGEVAVMFGDFELAPFAAARLGLFHLGGGRFNAFRAGFDFDALGEGDMAAIAARVPSARLRQHGEQALVEVDADDLARLRAIAEAV
jgi:hypothetical protein